MAKQIRGIWASVLAQTSARVPVGILWAIVVLGGIVRVWGNGFGLPHLYHPDEGYLVMPALRILHTGDFNPKWFDYGSLFIYVLFLTYIPYFLAGARAGVFRVVQDIPHYDNFRAVSAYSFPSLFLVSRTVSAVFGVATIVVTFLLAKRLFGKKMGIVAALLLALFPPVVLHAHVATVDTAMTFFVTLAILLSVQIYQSGGKTSYALAGLVAGLAISTKYSAFPVVATVLAAHLLQGRLRDTVRDHRLLLILGAVLVGFVVGSPFVLAEVPTFLNYLAKQLYVYGRPDSGLPLEPTYVWWLKYMFATELGPMTVLAMLGIGYMLKRQPKAVILLSASLVVFWGIILGQVTRYPRVWLPTAPILIVFAAYGLVQLASNLSSLLQRVLRLGTVPCTLVLLLPVVAFWGVIVLGNDWRMTQPDVRTVALRWIDDHLPEDSIIAMDLAGPPLPAPPWQMHRYLSLGEHPLDYYKSQGYDHVIVSQRGKENPNLTEAYKANLQSIETGARLVVDLSGACVQQADCHLWIYRLSNE